MIRLTLAIVLLALELASWLELPVAFLGCVAGVTWALHNLFVWWLA